MAEIVERVRELAATAVGALPRVGELELLTDSSATAVLGELSALRRHIDAAISLLAAGIERKSARELGAGSLARRAGARSGAELVQKITGGTRADAIKAVRVGGMLRAAHAVAPLPDATEAADRAGTGTGTGTGEGPNPDDGHLGGGAMGSPVGAPVLARDAPRSLDALSALPGGWNAPIAVAVRNGWLSADQGDRLTAGLGDPREALAAPQWRAACLALIGDCWAADMTPEDLKRAATAVRACLDREWAAENAHRLHEQRSLKRFVRADGMVKYDLLLDPLTDQEIWTPIYRHLAPRLGGPRFMTAEERAQAAELEADGRTNEQLLADTFTGFLTAGITADQGRSRGASRGSTKTGSTVTIAVTTSELRKAVTADAQLRLHGAGDHSHCPTATTGGCTEFDPGIGWTDGKPEPVTGPALLAAICNGNLGAILFDDTGQTLDITKHERTYSTRQRHAMALRDGGCLRPGCTMPPAACEAHHINPWNEHRSHQTTETRDGVLLCRFHHLSLHNRGAYIERRSNNYWLHWPGREPLRLIPKHALIAQLHAEAGEATT